MTLDFLVNSSDRVFGDSSADFYVEVPPGGEIEDYKEFELVNCSLKNSIFRLEGDSTKLACDIRQYSSTQPRHASDFFEAIVPPGTYSSDQLCTALELAIPEGLADGEHPTYAGIVVTCTYIAATGTFKVAVDSAWARGGLDTGTYQVFTIHDSTSDWGAAELTNAVYANSLNKILGFYNVVGEYPPALGTGFAGSQWAAMTTWTIFADRMDQLETPRALILCCDLAGGGMITSNKLFTPGQALATIPLSTYGSVAMYEPNTDRLLKMRGDRISRVHFWFLNEHLQRPNMNHQDVIILLRFHKKQT